VFAVVVVLTAIFLGLFWLANHFVFTQLSQITPPADVNVDTRTFAGAFLFGSLSSRRCSSVSCWRCS